MNQACGARPSCVTPEEIKGLMPAARPGRRRPLPGHGRLDHSRARRPATTGSRGRTQRRLAARGGPVPAHAGDGPRARRRPGDGRGDVARAIAAGAVLGAVGGRRDAGRGDGRRPPAGPHAPAARVRDQRPRPGLRPIVVASTDLRATSRRPSAARSCSAPRSTRSPRTRGRRRSRAPASCTRQDHALLPFLRDMRMLRPVGRRLRHEPRLLADHGRDRGRRLPDHDRLGDVGLQGDPGWRGGRWPR